MKVKQLETGFEWFWSREKFVNRKFVMDEMYEDFQEGEDWQVAPERDPFVESPDTECLIGTVEIYLQCVAYRVSSLLVNTYLLTKYDLFCFDYSVVISLILSSIYATVWQSGQD